MEFYKLIDSCFDCPYFDDEKEFCEDLDQKIVWNVTKDRDIFCPLLIEQNSNKDKYES